MYRLSRRLVIQLALGSAVLALAVVLAAMPLGALAQTAEPAASDGRHLSDESAATQAMFRGVWGASAAEEWAKEHTAAIAANPTSNAKVVIVTYGGSYQAGLDKAFFQPFAEQMHIAVDKFAGDNIDVLNRSRQEVASGHPVYDLTSTNQTYYQQGVADNLWEPIDYSVFNPDDLRAIPDKMRLKYGVGTIVYSNNLVFNTQAFAPGSPQPTSWADFWDVQKFPGKRAMPFCDSGINPVPEAALLADGVPPDQLYPIDVDRAAAKLKELAPNIINWKDGAESIKLLTDGTATMGLVGNGRAQVAIDQGQPLKIVWNGARSTFDVWYVLRGAQHREAAMQFLAFTQRPEAQAKLAELTGYAPTNPNAYKFLDKATADKLPTNPDIVGQTFQNDEKWWLDNRDKWVAACKAAVGQ